MYRSSELGDESVFPHVSLTATEFQILLHAPSSPPPPSIQLRDDELPFTVRALTTASGALLGVAVPLSHVPTARRRLNVRYTRGKALLVKFDSDTEADLSVELAVAGAEFSLDVDEHNVVLACCFRQPDAIVAPPAAFVEHFARSAWLRLVLAGAGDSSSSSNTTAPNNAATLLLQQQRRRDVSTESAFDSPISQSPAAASSLFAPPPSLSPGAAAAAALDEGAARVASLPVHLADVLGRAPLNDGALALLPPSQRFRHAVVRHIAWMCEPCRLVRVCERAVDVPALVQRDVIVPFVDAAWLSALRLRAEPQLRELDADPTPLIEWLSTPSRLFALRAVGTYFTHLLAYFLRDVCNFSFVVSKVQIFASKQTIGDIDMMFRVEDNQPAMAWELSIKNYVEVRDAHHFDQRAAADDPLRPLVQFCGPLSTGDSLWNIVQRTHARAAMLRARPEFEHALAALHVDAATTQTSFLLRGYLFEHWERDATPPPTPVPLPPDYGGVVCRAVRWLTGDDGLDTLLRLAGGAELAAATRFVPLNKFDLCAVAINADDAAALANLLPAAAFVERHRALLDDPVKAFAISLLRLTPDSATWLEIGRYFLLPSAWSSQKTGSL